MLKKAIATTISVMMLFTTLADARVFDDTADHWAKDTISQLADKGIISGMPDGLFYPDATVTVEQFVSMMLRAKHGEMAPTNDGWASGYMDYALSQSIIDYDCFANASKPVERRIVAKIIHEMLVKEYWEADSENVSGAAMLTDLYACESCASHISQVYAKGIMTGRRNDFFDGFGYLTRAEAATVIMRTIDPSLRLAAPAVPMKEYGENISEAEALEIMAQNSNTLLVDVRREDEYALGHIEGSLNVPVNSILENPDILNVAKDTPIIVYCKSGARSAKAQKALKDNGYIRVYNLGGVANWSGGLVF